MVRVANEPRPQGVLVVDKPRGPTSHDVVSRVRRTLGTREVGHAGTLDPMATGVLVVAIGEATKLVPWLTAHEKAYRATLRLGVATASLDAEGEVVEERAIEPELRGALASGVSNGRIAEALAIERARTEQIPPAVSAIKVDGVAAHARVRKGEVVELPPRPIAVRALEVLAARVDPPELDLEVVAAKGYYVRSLARDLAASLGTVGHLVALRRTKSGPFAIDEALPLEAFAPLDRSQPISPEVARSHLLPVATAASRALGAVRLSEQGVFRAERGQRLERADFDAEPALGPSAWLDGARLVAIGEWDATVGRVVRGFVT